MKHTKLVAFLLILSMIICTFSACKKEKEASSSSETEATSGEVSSSKTESADISTEDASGTESETSDNAPEKYAPLVLLEEGKVEEAYKLLIADKDNEQAKELLSKINVVFTNQTVKDNLFNEYSFEYEYDENGKVLSVTLVYKDGTKVKYIYEYDENGNMTKGYEGLLSISHTEIYYSYDSDNRIEKIIKRPFGTDIAQTTTYDYNAEGLVVKKTVSGDVDSDFIGEYEYDENGKITRYVITFADGNEILSENFYDKYGRLIEIKDSLDDASISCKMTYNRDGLIKNKTQYDTDGSVYFTIDYFYNDIGNPEKMIQIYGDDYRVTTRFFGYKYFYYPDGIPDSAKQNINEQ